MNVTITRPEFDSKTEGTDVMAFGAFEGADRLSRELARHRPSIRSADADLLMDKPMIDARSRDNTRNDGYVMGAAGTWRDSIVGDQFLLNSRPNATYLGLDDKWAAEFQAWAESTFMLWAESPECWPDASRHDTLTGLLRLAVVSQFQYGEILASVEWIRRGRRPYHTAIQLLEPDRLCNPGDTQDSEVLRGGIARDRYGVPQTYHIRDGYPSDGFIHTSGFFWREIPKEKPWGRIQMIHEYERMRPDQSRGVASMVAVLKQMHMTRKYQDVVLQNAVINATYAATIESELPRETALGMIGAISATSETGTMGAAVDYLQALLQYSEHARHLRVDGAQVPHLFPGSKLELRNAGSPGGIGSTFEQSLLRHTAAGLGLSYEQFSKDYSQINYSSHRASMNETHKAMQGAKKHGADRMANHIYRLWMEEELNRPDTDAPMPVGGLNFYDAMNKEAICNAVWIGSGRGQVDEMKETQAAVMRVNNTFSTLEEECARTGKDWREVMKQRKREKDYAEELGIELTQEDATREGVNDAQDTLKKKDATDE